MEDVYEELVRWYLRFNGFFCIENFVIHEPAPGDQSVNQGGEIDILAVRFPFSREQISGAHSKQIIRHPLLDSCEPRPTTEFLIAEVKGGSNISLNKLWRDHSPQYYERVKYIIRWCGCLASEGDIETVADDLKRSFHANYQQYSFRLIVFAPRKSRQAIPESVKVITFKQIVEFIINRAGRWNELGIATESKHNQWSELIKKLWDLAEPDNNEIEETDRVHSLLAYLEQTNSARKEALTNAASRIPQA